MTPLKRSLCGCLIFALGLSLWPPIGMAQEVKRDVSYGPGPSQSLDLSIPACKDFPTVIFIHGGSLTSGDKADEDYGNVALPFIEAGIACANVNYRLAPENAWPSQAEDVAAAIAWVRRNVAEYGGDPHRLFLLGHSSGAMLVALMGSDEQYLGPQGLKPDDLCGVMPMGSIMWDDELEQALKTHTRDEVEKAFAKDPDYRIYGTLDGYLGLWPIRHVHAGMPPFLFLIAEGEQEHPPVLKTNKAFVEKARELGCHADFKVLTDRTHMSAIRRLSEPGDPIFAIVLAFMERLGGTARK